MTIKIHFRSGIAAATIAAAIVVGSPESANAQRLPPATVLNSYSSIGAPLGVAAMVNGETIPTERVADVALRLTGGKVLDQLIGYVLIDEEAKRRGIVVTPEEVDARVGEIDALTQSNSLDGALQAHHMNLDDFKDDLRSGITVRKLLQNKLATVKMTHVRDLFVNISPFAGMAPNLHTESQAEQIMSTVALKLKKGTSFEQLARQYGDDAIDGKDGGDLGIISNFPDADQSAIARGFSQQPGFLNQCFSLKKGQIAGKLVRSRFGLHLIQVISTDSDPLPNEAKLYEDARGRAVGVQLTHLAPPFVDSLRRTARVTVYLGSEEALRTGVAATVNGKDVPLSKVTEIALSSMGPSIAETMIDTLLVEQEAAKQHVVVTPAQIDASIAQLQHESKGRSIGDLLKYGHMTLAEFRDTQKAKIEAEVMVAQGVGRIQAAHIRDIVIKIKPDKQSRVGHTEAQANAIAALALKQLQQGDNFEDVARRYSEDVASNTRGGDLGIITENDAYEPVFLAAAMGLKRGQTAMRPTPGSNALHLLQVVSTLTDHPTSEDMLYERAEENARQRKIWAQMPGFVAGLRTHSTVVDYISSN